MSIFYSIDVLRDRKAGWVTVDVVNTSGNTADSTLQAVENVVRSHLAKGYKVRIIPTMRP